MLKYVIGALIGGLVGYFVFYRLLGCSTGQCAITSKPKISILYGMILGVLFAGAIAPPSQEVVPENELQTSVIEYKKLTAREAKSRIDSGDAIIVVDVRTEDEYRAEHIPNAVLIPNETITSEMPDLLPSLDAEILLYCRSGNRSAQAAQKLIAMGYTNVYDFGGMIDWPYDTVTGP